MEKNNNILIVDDSKSIQEDFNKILAAAEPDTVEIDDLEKALFNKKSENPESSYVLDFASSGEEALDLVKKAADKGTPYALAFIDERMPPGWSGVETISKIWKIDPFLEVVLCTAYSDYSWDKITSKLGITDRLLFLKKPFDTVEVKQIAAAMTEKWNLTRQAREYEAELEKRVKEQTHIIRSMFEFANKINSMGNLDDVLDCIIDTVSNLMGCDRISIMLFDELNETLNIKRAKGITEDVISNTSLKVGESIAGRVYQDEEIVIINITEDEDGEKRFADFGDLINSPMLCAPIVGHNVKLGVINLTNKKDNKPFTEEDINVISYISYTAAIAINNTLLYSNLENEIKLRELAEEEQIQLERKILDISEDERRKIGMELHDGLGHDLLEISMKTGMLVDKVGEGILPEKEYVEKLERDIINSIKKNRNLAKGLFPMNLDDKAFGEIIEGFRKDLVENHNIECLVEVDSSVDINNIELSTHYFLIIQEAVRNIIKHSQAETVWIKVLKKGNTLTTSIKDNGAGLGNTETDQQGIGIKIMRYRARMIGAILDVVTNEDSGTEVICKIGIE